MEQQRGATIKYHRPTVTAFELNSTLPKQQTASYPKSNASPNTTLDCPNTTDLERLEQEQRKLSERIELLVGQARNLNKHERIRIKEWNAKLGVRQANPVWKKNTIFYLRVLSQMLREGKLMEPFNNLPPAGPLPKLTLYDLPFPLRDRFSQSRDRKNRPSNAHLGLTHSREKLSREKTSQMSHFAGLEYNQGWLLGRELEEPRRTKVWELEEVRLKGWQLEAKALLPTETKPNYLSNKGRNPEGGKLLGKGPRTGDKCARGTAIMAKGQIEEDKENDSNAINITRRLFDSKQKQQLTLESEHLDSDPSPKHNFQLSSEDSLYGCRKEKEERLRDQEGGGRSGGRVESQERALFPKMYRLLRHNEGVLGGQTDYNSLLSELERVGRDLALAQLGRVSTSQPLASSQSFRQASEALKSKLSETEKETVQFMQYLSRARSQRLPSSLRH